VGNLPKSPSEARKNWGINGTVSLDVQQIGEQLGVLVTVEYPSKFGLASYNEDRYGWGDPISTKDVKTVRFSGNPEAILGMFRALHIEYAKKLKRRRASRPTRTLILDIKES
jgi:hypothetical protein